MLKRISQPDQSTANTFKVYDNETGCCGSGLTACKSVITFPIANSATAITFKDRDGSNKTLTWTAATGLSALKAAVYAALKGYDFEDDGELLPAVSTEQASTNIVITIVGEIEVVSMTHSGGTANATVTCNQVGICTFFLAWPGNAATSAFVVNGVSATIAALTLAGNTAANVVSALEGAANWPAANTSVAVVETATAFEITITSLSTDLFTLNGLEIERQQGCVPDFI